MIKNKKILAIVPARGGSKEIKLKNLKKIKNKSLIEITSKFIDNCSFIDAKALSSDHPKILKEGKRLKFKNIKRPKKLSGSMISDYKVIKHTLKLFIKQNFYPDYIVYLQPTSPIRKKQQLINALKKVIKNKYDGSWSVTKISQKYNFLKLLKIYKNKLYLINNNGKKVIARQMLKPNYIRNGVFYIFETKKLIKAKSIYLNKIFPSITNYKIANIDNLEDLKNARELI